MIDNWIDTMTGYCALHDFDYDIIQGDEVCPICLANKERDLKWRTDEDNSNG